MNKQVEYVLACFNHAKGAKSVFDTQYNNVFNHIYPGRNTYYKAFKMGGSTNKNKNRTSFITNLAYKFTSHLESITSPSGDKFFKYGNDDFLEKQDQFENYALFFQLLNKKVFKFLDKSNFCTEQQEFFHDLIPGTATLKVDAGSKEDPFQFTFIPVSQVFCDEGLFGRIDKVFREYEIEKEKIQQFWPEAVMPDFDSDLTYGDIKDGKKPVKLLEATVPLDQAYYGSRAGKKTLYGFCYLVMSANGKHVFFKKDIESSPWIVARYSVTHGEIYGRGPGFNAISDISTLNRMCELDLIAASMSALPPITAVNNGVTNFQNISFKPNAIIPVDSNNNSYGTGATLQQMRIQSNLNFSTLKKSELEQNIMEMFLSPDFGGVRGNDTVRTLGELTARQNESRKYQGNIYNRLKVEYVTPLAKRLLFIMDDLGIVDDVALQAGIQQVDRKNLYEAIEVISPLNKALDQEKQERLLLMAQSINNISGRADAAFDYFNEGELIDQIRQLSGVEKELVKSKNEVKQMTQQRQEMAMQAMQQQQGG